MEQSHAANRVSTEAGRRNMVQRSNLDSRKGSELKTKDARRRIVVSVSDSCGRNHLVSRLGCGVIGSWGGTMWISRVRVVCLLPIFMCA